MPRNTRLSPNFILHVLQNGGVENVSELTQHSPKIKLDKTSNILENHPFSSSNLRFHCLLLFHHTFLLHALRHLLCTRKEKINMDEEREKRKENGERLGRLEEKRVDRERNETNGMRKEGSERGWQRVCRSSIGRFSPRSSIPIPGSAHGFASTSGSIRPWMVWGRAAGGARQIRELHCQAGMIYLTNISI